MPEWFWIILAICVAGPIVVMSAVLLLPILAAVFAAACAGLALLAMYISDECPNFYGLCIKWAIRVAWAVSIVIACLAIVRLW